MRITHALVERTEYAHGDSTRAHYVMDDELRGFGLRIYKSGRKAFILRYYNADGRRRFHQLGTWPVLSTKAARKLAVEKLAEVAKGGDPADERTARRKAATFGDLCDRFLADYCKVHRKTWKQDEVMLGRLAGAFGSRKVEGITGGDIATLHAALGEEYGPRSANKTVNLMRRMWNVCAEWGEIPAALPNPAARVKRFPEKSRDRWLSESELRRLIEAIDAEADYVPSSSSVSEAIVTYLRSRREARVDQVANAVEHPRRKTAILLASLVTQGRAIRVERGVYALDPEGAKWGDLRAIYIRAELWLYILTGCRKSELLGARWEDVDFERAELRLPETKSGEPARVPLSDPAVNILRGLPRLSGNPFVFPGAKRGQPLANIWKRWDRIRKRAGLADVRLHDLRRTVGSWLASAGNSILVVQQALHHKSYSAALIYAKLSEDPVKGAMQEHGRAVMEAASGRS